MKSANTSLAILLCAAVFVSAYFFGHRHLDIDEYDRLML